MKYRKKPVEIEAMQLTQDNVIEVLTFCNKEGIIASNDDGTISITTLEGTMTASIGDYVIKGVKGEFYPCKPDIFEATYEKVEEEEMAFASAPIWANIQATVNKDDLINIAEWLSNDPRVTKIETDTETCQLHFEVNYGDEVVWKENDVKVTWESFTVYEGTTIVRENAIYRTYRTEEQNG